MLTLILKEGGAPVTLNMEHDVISIGRSKENNIVLKNIKASRRHARIERVGATYQITDLGSGNGTRVNNKKIDIQALNKGDEIRIGDATLTLKSIDETIDAMDVEEELKLEETDAKLEIAEERDTEILIKEDVETELEVPAAPPKKAPMGKPAAAAKPAPARPALAKPGPAKPPAAPAAKPVLGRPAPGGAKPGLKKPFGRQPSK